MKQTLVLCLLFGLAASAMAQAPTVVEKATSPVKATSAAKPAQTNPAINNSKPANVRVVAVPAAQAKPAAGVAKAAAKPAVVAVQPSAKPAVAVVPAKAAATSAKPAVAVVPAKAAATSAKPAVAVVPAKAAATSAKPLPAKASTQGSVVAVKSAPSVKTASPGKGAISAKGGDPFSKKKPEAQAKAAPAVVKAPEKKTGAVVAVNEGKSAEAKKAEPKNVSAVAHRDPFVSPIVHMGAAGSGCSTGKRCLAIDQIALRGVVRSENGMIAVVVNTMDKAYFLRENDPVFNGYVTKITSDSIIFKETFRDKLGKELTRDVTKTIIRPAA
jgi:hypothetical protein